MRRSAPVSLLVLVPLLALGGGRGPFPAAAGDGEPASYTETIPRSAVSFEMIPVPGGTFAMGSTEDEAGRRPDEGPRHRVAVGGFWMGKHEVTWAEYDLFRSDETATVRRADEPPPGADAITRPTPAYADETFGFGKAGQPVLSITHQAAVEYTRWLSRRTGKNYRLPTEAEWEWACRAGGNEEGPLAERAWFEVNSEERPRPVGEKAPDRHGLFDLLGNVGEWVLDRYEADAYASRAGAEVTGDPLLAPDGREYPHVVRGGSWADPADRVRCASRLASALEWNERDPQYPQSIWWLTDATFAGFRVVRPFETRD